VMSAGELHLSNGIKAHTTSCGDVPHHLLKQQHRGRRLRLHC